MPTGGSCKTAQPHCDSPDVAATDPAELRHHADDAPHAGDRAATRDDHALLHFALGRLDRDDREVLLLSRFQEMSFAEVAGVLECSVGAARVRAHRALRELRGLCPGERVALKPATAQGCSSVG